MWVLPSSIGLPAFNICNTMPWVPSPTARSHWAATSSILRGCGEKRRVGQAKESIHSGGGLGAKTKVGRPDAFKALSKAGAVRVGFW